MARRSEPVGGDPRDGRIYLGVEIGGTKLQAALGDGRGLFEKVVRVAAEAQEGRERICQQVLALVRSLLDPANAGDGTVKRIGVGFGGPVDPAAGLVVTSHQVLGWDDFPLAGWLRDHTGVGVVLGNDSDLAGLAEALFGAGRGLSRVFYMNIGSGIGGAIILDGRIYTSQGAGASEIGHLRIRKHQDMSQWQTLEEIASGWAIGRLAREVAGSLPGHPLNQWTPRTGAEVTAQTFFLALKEGFEPFQTVYRAAIIEPLAVAIANVITLLRPEVFVIGGGVSLVGDILFEPLREEVDRQVFPPFRGSYRIVPAALGEDVVLHGALALARQPDAPGGTWE